MKDDNSNLRKNDPLNLRAGDWVEVRTVEEILGTLDDRGCLDALPFMPEMLQYCGKRFRVFKSAHKACDTINKSGNRWMANSVHLEGLRCDGEAHGGCQARCLLYWKEAWLKRVSDRASKNEPDVRRAGPGDFATLSRATKTSSEGGHEVYRCQATELFRATTTVRWWDPRQYAKDLYSGNVRIRDFFLYVLIAAYNMVMRLHWRGRPYPHVQGRVEGKTPAQELNLQPGELVEVRSKKEIELTLGKMNNRNRGLWFDVEMVPFCGHQFRVLSRVDRLIDERTGKMIHTGSPCLILDGVMCGGCLSENRLFCPRAIYSYWHEIWLKRVEQPKAGESQQTTLRA